ncbi:hypothetical protein K1719_025290 [Acacia pycnantha]|nr:hypothetical protein K1719_025290 [Acacia pycnantha]
MLQSHWLFNEHFKQAWDNSRHQQHPPYISPFLPPKCGERGELTGRRSRALQASLVSGLGKDTCSSIKDKLSERNLVEGAVSVSPTEPSNNPGRGQFSKQGKVSGAKG